MHSIFGTTNGQGYISSRPVFTPANGYAVIGEDKFIGHWAALVLVGPERPFISAANEEVAIVLKQRRWLALLRFLQRLNLTERTLGSSKSAGP